MKVNGVIGKSSLWLLGAPVSSASSTSSGAPLKGLRISVIFAMVTSALFGLLHMLKLTGKGREGKKLKSNRSLGRRRRGEERATYCRLSGKRIVCPYAEEERTVMFCIACRTTRLASQQDLMIKQNKAIITLLNQIRDLLQKRTE